MRCHHCHAKWSLCDGFGPGGNAAPGYYSIAALVLALIAFAIAYFFYSLYGIILAALLGFMALALFVMAICSCGIQKLSGFSVPEVRTQQLDLALEFLVCDCFVV
jgi:hypothetical protein